MTPAAQDRKFNTFDGGAFAFEAFWPRLAGWYGLEWEGPKDGTEYTTRETLHNPRGYGGKGVVRKAFSLVDWVKQEKVQQAWAKIAEEHGLSQKKLVDPDRVFGFADGSLGRSASLILR